MINVLTAIFNVESEGYQAFKEIQDDLASERYLVPQMALVKKSYGYLKTIDSYESEAIAGEQAFSGGLFGSLIGILGGPIGILLGGATGAMIGAQGDAVSSDAATSLLDAVTEKLSDGSVAIVALVNEENEAALDGVLAPFDAVVIRRDAAFVAEEVAEAERLQAEMAQQARAQLRAEKKQQLSDAVQQKVDQMKADFEAFKEKFKK